MKEQLKNIFILIFFAVILNGCGATLQTYKPVENPNILDAMRTVRNKILAQPEQKAASQVEVTETTLKITNTFVRPKFWGTYDEDVVKLIIFKDITGIRYHTKRDWFMVSLVNENIGHLLFRYYSHSEMDAQHFIDNIQTLISHKKDPLKPIALTTTPPLSPAEIKTLMESLDSFVLNPNTEKFAITESKFLSALENIEQVSGKNHTDVSKFINSLAAVYQSLGKYEQAEPLYNRSLVIQEKYFGKDDIKVTTILDNLARLYAEQGRFQKAENFAQKSLAIKEKVLGKKDVSVIASLNILSSINQAQRHYERADMFNQRSLSIMEKLVLAGHLQALAASQKLFNGMQITPSQYDSGGVAKGFNQVTGIIGLVVGGIILTDAFLSLFDVGMLASEKRNKKIVNTTALAAIHHAQGKYTLAEPLFKEVVELNKKQLDDDHPNLANSLSRLAKNYYAQGKYKESEPLLHQAIEIYEKKLGNNHPTAAKDLNILALVHAAQNQYKRAKPLFKRSLRSINRSLNRWLWGVGEKTRLAYLQQQETQRDIYLSFYSLTDSAHEALFFSLTRKGLLLKISSEVSALAKQSAEPTIKKKIQSFNTLRTELSTLYLTEKIDQTKIQVLEEKSNTIEQQLSQQISSFKRNKTEVTPTQVLENLNSEESLVDFLIYKEFDFKSRKFKAEQVIALVANKQNGVQLVKLGNLASIAGAIKVYRSKISTLSSVKLSAKSLYQKLWAPLTPYLKNIKTVYLIPDGSLHLLPFKALQDQEGQYLTEKWQLVTVSSSRDIVLRKKADKTTTTAVIFAAPDFGDVNVQSSPRGSKAIYFNELPGTLKEGQQIEQLFAEKKSHASVELFLKKQATEKKITSIKSPKILHIATHGFFTEDYIKDDKALKRGLIRPSAQPQFIQNPLARSGLAFADANLGNKQTDNTDGILTALEVLNLNLESTDLVVLSACDTGIGNIKVGEGVYSLNRSFQEAGAKMVLSTLWSVADEATEIFMRKFYARFLGGESAQKALQETQNEFIHDKQYSNPFYWAGFGMTGKE